MRSQWNHVIFVQSKPFLKRASFFAATIQNNKNTGQRGRGQILTLDDIDLARCCSYPSSWLDGQNLSVLGRGVFVMARAWTILALC